MFAILRISDFELQQIITGLPAVREKSGNLEFNQGKKVREKLDFMCTIFGEHKFPDISVEEL